MASGCASIRRGLVTGQSLALFALFLSLAAPLTAQDAGTTRATSPANGRPASAASAPVLPRGKKLMLTDGSFHLVREYKLEGDRVRYYSLDRSQWEEIPAALVDWDATKKVEAEEAQRDAAIVAKVHAQEAARLAQPLDIDASLEVAPGVFLPPGENLFVFDGKSVLPLTQAETSSKLSKGHLLKKVLIPVPIVSTRYTVSIQGTRAKFRIQENQPEFYIRTADLREPQLELIRAKISGGTRQIENLDKLFGDTHSTRDTLPMQRWEVARGVYRFTLGQGLVPGEYVFAEIVQGEDMSLYVWDFGVDSSSAPPAAAPR
ncbi:MAG TPA: hypothetical protein VJO53_05430 [Candidatus Acidoferrales bacterium]|nr:hypothetical protein [Candidatus Acidoferrales bacterium]